MLVVGTSVIVVVAVPVMVAVLVPLATTFYFLRRYFMNASREVKRLESTTRSPVYATFSASLKGLATIRAFKGAKERFLAKFNQEQDANSVWWFAFMSIARWVRNKSFPFPFFKDIRLLLALKLVGSHRNCGVLFFFLVVFGRVLVYVCGEFICSWDTGSIY